MREILLAASFQEKGFSWKSFPNHTGHADTPGCFRCHDGKHYNDKGEAIRLQCTLCHALPEVVREKGKGTVPSTVGRRREAAGEPPEPNFMHTHRFKIDDTLREVPRQARVRARGRQLLRQPGLPRPQWPAVNLNVETKAAAPAPAAVPAAAATKTSAPAKPEKAKAEKK